MATNNPGYLRQWRARQKAQGLCTQCTRTAVPGKTRCEVHRQAVTGAVTRWQEGQRRKGLCRMCPEPALEGFAYCDAHRNHIIVVSRLRRKGTKQSRFTEDDVRDIKGQLRQHVPIALVAEQYHVPYHAIWRLKKAKKWAHL